MSKILIIGYGNPMRKDDGLGPAACVRLEGLVRDEDVKIMVRHQMGMELTDDIACADLAIFIDAHVGGSPGTLKEEAISPDTAVPGSFSHHMRPGVLLGCVQALYSRHPDAVIYSITGQSFDFGEGLSSAVEAALPILINKVLAKIAQFKSING
ncbi:MAG: hydrogenase maturation protease [Dissulfurispiraceae bacterium]|jgi:hydrogenase maturation protease